MVLLEGDGVILLGRAAAAPVMLAVVEIEGEEADEASVEPLRVRERRRKGVLSVVKDGFQVVGKAGREVRLFVDDDVGVLKSHCVTRPVRGGVRLAGPSEEELVVGGLWTLLDDGRSSSVGGRGVLACRWACSGVWGSEIADGGRSLGNAGPGIPVESGLVVEIVVVGRGE